MVKRQGWDTVATWIPAIQEKAPELRLLITGVAGLKRMAKLAQAFPSASFTNTTAHYLAQRYLRLRREGARLIKEPVKGHPDLILDENVRLLREFLSEQRGDTLRASTAGPQPCPSIPAVGEVTRQTAYGLTSLPAQRASPEQLLDYVRTYWGIENGLHYRRDVTFKEDRRRLRIGHAARTMATLKNLVLALILRQGYTNVPPKTATRSLQAVARSIIWMVCTYSPEAVRLQ